jgi:flagellar hook-associated protein 1 FlgK
MSTFGGISVAWTGLVAARAGMDMVGQNIANSATEGYTRQRVVTSSNPAVAAAGHLDGAIRPGQGVSVTGISRLGDALSDARVSTASASSGYAEVTSQVMDGIETSLREPGSNGLAAILSDFWSSWQNMANHAGDTSAGGVLLESAQTLAGRIAQGYSETTGQWSNVRTQIVGTVQEINALAGQVAQLNDQVRQVTAAGGTANELFDARTQLTTRLATLAGASVVLQNDGTASVMVGGNPLVEGKHAHALEVSGATRFADAAGSPVLVAWSSNPGVSAGVEGGRLAAGLAAVSTGASGPLAQAAATYNALATQLATAVNAVHTSGATPGGATGLNFFSLAPGVPAALGLGIVPTDATEIAAGIPGAGGASGGTADAIASLGLSNTGPDAAWSTFVVGVGITTRRATDQQNVTGSALSSVTALKTSQTGVDLDEETANLLMFQHAYQGAARVLTAIDEMLDVLINRTGLVGR